jgi:hypothetical protein
MGPATLVRVTAAVLGAGLFAIATAAEAATIWTGPRITFSKLRADNEQLPAFQDRLTPRVWLTRGSSRGLYNIKQESGFTRASSPADTEWAFGTTGDLPNLKFTNWVSFHGGCSPCQVGRAAVLHLISEDIYIDIKVLSWPAGTGNVTYERSTPPNAIGTGYSIEYYHSDFKHYFTTANPLEAAGLDGVKVPGGWARTGQFYSVFVQPAAGLMPVCRFFSAQFAPKSSHFYTADPDECNQLKTTSGWLYEGDAFFVDRQDAGTCPPDTAPLHRLYNAGQGGSPNHRYTTCSNIRDRMLKNGWVSEGVAMCVARESFDCNIDLSFGAVPGAPIAPQATPGNANVTITFRPPASSEGDLPITSYTARCTAGGVNLRTGTNTASPITVRGVANGVQQTCNVFATNSVGDGPLSISVVATPAAINNANYNTLAIPPLLTADDARWNADLRSHARAFIEAIHWRRARDRHLQLQRHRLLGTDAGDEQGRAGADARAQPSAGRHHDALARLAVAWRGGWRAARDHQGRRHVADGALRGQEQCLHVLVSPPPARDDAEAAHPGSGRVHHRQGRRGGGARVTENVRRR